MTLDLLSYICCLSALNSSKKLYLRINRFYGTFFVHSIFLEWCNYSFNCLPFVCFIETVNKQWKRKTTMLVCITLKYDYQTKITRPLIRLFIEYAPTAKCAPVYGFLSGEQYIYRSTINKCASHCIAIVSAKEITG